MNIIVKVNGEDVTQACRLQETRINYDSTRRLTTASLTFMGNAPDRTARYDYAHYDEDVYALDLRELYEVEILDGRDGVTKLFDGQIYQLAMEQSDGPTFEVFFKAELNDWSALLDRAVCWDSTYTLPLPSSDREIILALLGQFCPGIALADVAEIVPVIEGFDWLSKTARQVLDDLAALSGGEWFVDFDAQLHYRLPAAAPAAPFSLSTSPDFVTSFPVNVSGYRHDFSNPINKAYVRGAADPASGAFIEASYSDPLSIAQYGEYAAAIVDEQIISGWDASLRAKSTVLRYSTPIEQGNFTIWKDGLALGMQVEITEESLGLSGQFVIRALTMAWESQDTVRYEAQFGAAQPDLETLLRLLDQRSRWKTTVPQVANPAPGSITDANIAPPGLSASSIHSVSAGTIIGLIDAGQIGSVNAGAIVGQIESDQIESVAAGSIEGVITADQIGSVNAGSITGVIISSQLADKIIDNIAKYADALAPVPMLTTPPSLPSKNHPPNSFFYYIPDGHFYRIDSAGSGYALNDNPSGSLMSFYHIGAISAQSIVGVIAAAQIGSITAGQITGLIQASQIQSVNASAISGAITASQIATVNASSIQGTISSSQIGSVSASSITGTLVAGQIGSIDAATITIGLIQNGQINTISGGKIIAGTVASDKLDAFSIDVGGGSNKPGRFRVFDASSSVIAEIGTLSTGNYGGWFRVFGAGGNNYSDAKIKSDTAGNLAISNATFTVTSSPWTVSISPSTNDAIFGSLAIQVYDSSYKASLVSQGLILYVSGSKIASINRNPSGWGEVVVGSGGTTIILSGGDGTCRADGGFTSGGQVGRTVTLNISGTILNFKGGILVP